MLRKFLKINLKNKNIIIRISYIVLLKKGYQQFQEPRGTSVIKVKGIARVNGSNILFNTSSDETKYIWDTPEYEIPPIVC